MQYGIVAPYHKYLTQDVTAMPHSNTAPNHVVVRSCFPGADKIADKVNNYMLLKISGGEIKILFSHQLN